MNRSIYKKLEPGDIEMGKNNPVLLSHVVKGIINQFSKLETSRKLNGINLCFLSSGAGRTEVYLLENLCKNIYKTNIRIKKVLLVDYQYDETFIKDSSNPLKMALDQLLDNSCIESYSFLSEYNNIYTNEYNSILKMISEGISMNDIVNKYKIDMFIGFHFQDNSFIRPGIEGYIQFVNECIDRFNLYEKFKTINEICQTEIIPDRIITYYNKNNEIIEMVLPFPDVKEKYIEDINKTVISMLKDDKNSTEMKNILKEKQKVLFKNYNYYKEDKQKYKQGGGYEKKYIYNKNKYIKI